MMNALTRVPLAAALALLLAPSLSAAQQQHSLIIRAATCATYNAPPNDLSFGANLGQPNDVLLASTDLATGYVFGHCDVYLPDGAVVDEVVPYGWDNSLNLMLFQLRRALWCSEDFERVTGPADGHPSTNNAGLGCAEADWPFVPNAPLATIDNYNYTYWFWFFIHPDANEQDLRLWNIEIRYTL